MCCKFCEACVTIFAIIHKGLYIHNFLDSNFLLASNQAFLVKTFSIENCIRSRKSNWNLQHVTLSVALILYKKSSFPLKTSLVNLIKSNDNAGVKYRIQLFRIKILNVLSLNNNRTFFSPIYVKKRTLK